MITFNVLPIEEIKFVKTIIFYVEFLGKKSIAKIVYKRNPSSLYKIDETKRSEIDKMMYFYPEECYPKDAIDEMIYAGIKSKYPSAQVHTKLMLCDVEKERIENELSQYQKETFQINIQPLIRDLDDVVMSGKTQFRVFQKNLPLYIIHSADADIFKFDGSFAYYELDKENEMIALEPTLLNEVTSF